MPDVATRKAIKNIPADGWWHPDGQETFERLADELVDRGFSADDAVEFLTAAYTATAGEFGA